MSKRFVPTESSSLRPSKDVTAREFDGECVLLDLASGKYFGLDEVGGRMWHLLSRGLTLGEIPCELTKEFDVDSARALADTLAFADVLVSGGLMEERLPGQAG